MDIINWWLSWPAWLQDASIVLLVLMFLSHGGTRWPRMGSARPA